MIQPSLKDTLVGYLPIEKKEKSLISCKQFIPISAIHDLTKQCRYENSSLIAQAAEFQTDIIGNGGSLFRSNARQPPIAKRR